MGSHEFHRREVGAGRSVALVDDVFYQVGGLFDVQFSHNIGTVMFYCADAYRQKIGNLSARNFLGNEL
jgi:hypothetical protein